MEVRSLQNNYRYLFDKKFRIVKTYTNKEYQYRQELERKLILKGYCQYKLLNLSTEVLEEMIKKLTI